MKEALVKSLIVLVPSYGAAFLTDKMVYVVPTLVAAGFFASSIQLSDRPLKNRVDEDSEDDEGDESSLIEVHE